MEVTSNPKVVVRIPPEPLNFSKFSWSCQCELSLILELYSSRAGMVV